MSRHEDQALLEAVKTHRQRLLGAFIAGTAGVGRGARSLTGRLIGSLVIAAIACAVCVGVSFVLSVLPTLNTPAAQPQTTSAADQNAEGAHE